MLKVTHNYSYLPSSFHKLFDRLPQQLKPLGYFVIHHLGIYFHLRSDGTLGRFCFKFFCFGWERRCGRNSAIKLKLDISVSLLYAAYTDHWGEGQNPMKKQHHCRSQDQVVVILISTQFLQTICYLILFCIPC